MPLSNKTKRSVVNALSAYFDEGEIGSLLAALDGYQTTSPPLSAGTPNFSMYLPGMYYDASFMGNVTTPSYAAAANTIDLIPFFVNQDLKVNEFTIGVTTGVAATNARVLIYEAGDNMRPDRKVYESANLSTATSTTAPAVAASFTFVANTVYWIGVHTDGIPTLRGLRDYSVVPLGYATAATASTGLTMVRRVAAFGSAPASWNFVNADLASALPPSVRFKVA